MRFLILITVLFAAINAECCYCLPDNRPLQEKIKNTSYIALVKVIGFEEAKPITSMIGGIVHLKLEIITMFKGDKNKAIYETDVNTSCDKGMRMGGEWLLFAYGQNDTASFTGGTCGLSIQLRNASGERTGSDYGNSMMDSLRLIYNLPAEKKRNGTYREYFADGKLSVVENYRSGILSGTRKIYYSTGHLQREEHYDNGKMEGIQRDYSRSGQLLWERYIEWGEQITSTMWYDTAFQERRMLSIRDHFFGTKDQLDSFALANPIGIIVSIEYVYNKKTSVSTSRQYNWNGFLQRTIEWNRNADTRTYTDYFKSGSVKVIELNDEKNQTADRKEWNEAGKIISHKVWKNSKLTLTETFDPEKN
jgi:antitoxin component YwqK of YwqJK toxin-antitoxin module